MLKLILIHYSFHYFPNCSISSKESGKLTPAVSGRKRPGKAPITVMMAMIMKGALSDKTAWNYIAGKYSSVFSKELS